MVNDIIMLFIVVLAFIKAFAKVINAMIDTFVSPNELDVPFIKIDKGPFAELSVLFLVSIFTVLLAFLFKKNKNLTGYLYFAFLFFFYPNIASFWQ